MRTLLAATSLLLLSSLSGLYAAATQEEVAQAIQTFLKDPTSPEAKAAGKVIFTYSQETPDHEISIDEKALPWLKSSGGSDRGTLLLVAFISGDLQEQFRKGTGKPETYAGVLTVLSVYEKLKAKSSIYFDPNLEHFIDLEKNGKLKEFLEAK